jgi:hypothetical protein
VEHPKKTPTPGIAMRIADELGFDWTWFFQEDRIPEELRESEVKRWTKDAANDFVALCERRGVKPAEAIKALSDYAERQKNAVG